MDILTTITVLVPSVLTSILAVITTVLSQTKIRSRKKELAWITAEKMIIAVAEKDGSLLHPKNAKKCAMFFDYMYTSLCHIGLEDIEKLQKHYQDTPSQWLSSDSLMSGDK